VTAPGEKEAFDKLRDIFLGDVGIPEDHEETKVHKSAALSPRN
jgi:hypothetical protein